MRRFGKAAGWHGMAAGLAALISFATPSEARSLRIEGGAIADVAADQAGIRVFKGIPFAAPPVGDLRWKPPQPVPPWKAVRSVSEWGPRCMQSNRLGDLDPLNKRMEEDCLYLNVWTPGKSSGPALPVMVWIHGGSNANGAGSQPDYDGAALARKGVVVVTINYRLDVFGFLAHPDLTKESSTNSSGNSLIRSPRSNGCRRTSAPSAAIRGASLSSANPPALSTSAS